jgi:hypothetical protein
MEMNRFLASGEELVFGQREAVVEILQECFGVWALEISLLLTGFVESLTVRSSIGGTLLLSLLSDKSVKRGIVSHGGTNKLGVVLSRNQAEYLQAVLLRAYRDRMADVDHVHIEGSLAGAAYDLTFFFGASRPAVSAEEAAKFLQD